MVIAEIVAVMLAEGESLNTWFDFESGKITQYGGDRNCPLNIETEPNDVR